MSVPDEPEKLLIELSRAMDRRAAADAQVEYLRTLLRWVASNYMATLSGKPVRDADECLEAARIALRDAA